MYVGSLRIENLRCFESAEVDLQFPGREQDNPPPLPNVNLLLGNNGAGKTTVLKAIALGVLGYILPGSGYVPYNLIRRAKERPDQAEAETGLLLHRQDRPPGEEEMAVVSGVRIARRGTQEQFDFAWMRPSSGDHSAEDEVRLGERVANELFDDDSPAFLLTGYGSTRWVSDASDYEPPSSQRKRRRFRYQRVAGLFEEHVGLTPLAVWLPRFQSVNPDGFEQVLSLFNRLLPRETRFFGEADDDEYLFKHCGVEVPLGALSDGYRAYIGWISDLLYNISLGTPKGARLRDAQGVVLVDEIDLHLHPEWQREVVPTVARALPNLQFVLTTHSPIVAGTLSAQNIFVLEMDGAGASTIRQFTEPIHGLNADQILVSSYFGLDTTRAKDTEDELRQLSEKAMSGDSGAALEFLKKIAAGTERS